MLRQDLRDALRALRRRPGFTAVAMATLALGIGANTAIFTVVNAVLLRPLPFPDADRLAHVNGGSSDGRQPGNLSPMDFMDLRERTRRFERMAAYNNYADATLTGAGEPERIAGTRVTADFFGVLGVAPRIGRDFRTEDDQPSSSRVAILSDGFWRRRFAADAAIVGRIIHLNSVPVEVIGVLPARFVHPFPDNFRQPDVYVPFRLDRAENNRGGHYLHAVARLGAGASLGEARQELVAIAGALEREYPRTNTGRGVRVDGLFDSMVAASRAPLLVLLGAVAAVLLIACANLANLLLARATSRQKEIAVRQALGAGRGQLVRQLLTESVVLALAGGACGLLLAWWGTQWLVALGADRVLRGDGIALDWRVLAFTLGVAFAAGTLFGVGPALTSTRLGAEAALRDGGRTAEGRIRRRDQQTLIAAEVALTLMLLVCAGLLVKSFWRLAHVDPGFRAEQVLTLRTSLPIARYPEGDQIPFYRRFADRIAPLPGVRQAGAVNILPLDPNYSCDGFQIDGRTFAAGEEPCAEARSVTTGYFEAMGIPLVRGRFFSGADTDTSPAAMIISRRMAEMFWPGQDPVGTRLTYQRQPRQIVGVVADVKHFGLDRIAPLQMYTPHTQQPSYHTMSWVIRTDGDPLAPAALVRHELRQMDPEVPISALKTLERQVEESTTEPRFRMVLVGAFSALAIVLSVVGVAGVIAYTVSRRSHEIGVRLALGASRRSITSLVVRQGLVPTAIGLLLGLAGAVIATRALRGLLFGVTATDPVVFISAAALLAIAAGAATYLPARRATAIDPMAALRSE